MVRINSSTVHSRRRASVASATSSVERGPIMWTPRISSYFLSATILTKPSISPAILARLRLRQPDAADFRIAIGAAGHVVVIDRAELVAGDPLGEDHPFGR